jgi:hypothetical protein
MLLRSRLRDVLLLSWRVPPRALARKLPPGVEPDPAADGSALVSAVAVRSEGVRLGAVPLPGFAQLTVRTYALVADEPVVFFLSLRITTAGLPAAAFGIPVRPGSIRVRPGRVRARALGFEAAYRPGEGTADVPELASGPVGHQQAACFASAGVRRLGARHEAFGWRPAILEGEPRVEPVLALGFDVGAPDSTLCADGVGFETTLPPAAVCVPA